MTRIQRAECLAEKYPESADLLLFYIDLLKFQERIARRRLSAGESLVRHYPELFELVARNGTEVLAAYAREHLNSPESQTSLLTEVWNNPNLEALDPAARFFARVLLQPWAEQIAAQTQIRPEQTQSTCPVCNAKPLTAVLRGEGEGAKRHLLCSLCNTEWPYRRLLCPNCGEENKDHLPVFQTPEIPHVRIDACDTCRAYLKSIDLTKDGHAVPPVDDLATLALDVWAEENGYTKLEPNLLGM